MNEHAGQPVRSSRASGPSQASSTASSRRALVLLAAIALVVCSAGGGCSKTKLYTYVDIHLVIDQTVSDDQLFQISSCDFQVTGTESEVARSLRCLATTVHRDVGTLQWSTDLKSGTVQFVVTVFDPNRVPIGEGTSDPITIVPGQSFSTTLTVSAVGGGGNDAGTSADGPAEAGSDGTANADGGVDETDAVDDTADDVSRDATPTEAGSEAGGDSAAGG